MGTDTYYWTVAATVALEKISDPKLRQHDKDKAETLADINETRTVGKGLLLAATLIDDATLDQLKDECGWI